tara:strand:+ start:65 stop:508 length:444 start_codon:yes stop_codon:yes gene_type:complete
MSVYKATSWGRTRRPKGLKDTSTPASKETATTVNSVTSSALLQNSLDGALDSTNGYITENQRYLHILVAHSASAVKTVDIYGYNYNFGEWALIVNQDDGDGTRSKYTLANGSAGAAQQFIFDISGIDRVAFVSADAPSTIKAACSTF